MCAASPQSLEPLQPALEAGDDLSDAAIGQAVAALLSSEVPEEEKSRFLAALRAKGETAAEIAGFATALLDHALDPKIDPALAPGPLLDICGTGGDQLHLFNVSTTSMFVLAAGGAAVVKHGNRAITSQCGGADVLEALGVQIEVSPAALRECVQRHGVGFLFAPVYHPAFRVIAPVRQRLAAVGLPTIFNLLGPLLNPARPAHQFIGLFDRAILHKYAEALALLRRERGWVVHGAGMDELSITGLNEVCEVSAAEVRDFQIDPATLGLPPAPLADLRGGDRARNAAILTGILAGEIQGGPRAMVLLNAAAGFVICGLAPDLQAGLARAAEQIDSGRATAKLNALRSLV